MSTNLEKRIENLEREVQALRSAARREKNRSPWWERLAGTFENDPLFDEMVEAGRKYRKSVARRSNGRYS